MGCDEFTSKYYLSNYDKIFPVGGFDDYGQLENNGKILIFNNFKNRKINSSL